MSFRTVGRISLKMLSVPKCLGQQLITAMALGMRWKWQPLQCCPFQWELCAITVKNLHCYATIAGKWWKLDKKNSEIIIRILIYSVKIVNVRSDSDSKWQHAGFLPSCMRAFDVYTRLWTLANICNFCNCSGKGSPLELVNGHEYWLMDMNID